MALDAWTPTGAKENSWLQSQQDFTQYWECCPGGSCFHTSAQLILTHRGNSDQQTPSLFLMETCLQLFFCLLLFLCWPWGMCGLIHFQVLHPMPWTPPIPFCLGAGLSAIFLLPPSPPSSYTCSNLTWRKNPPLLHLIFWISIHFLKHSLCFPFHFLTVASLTFIVTSTLSSLCLCILL